MCWTRNLHHSWGQGRQHYEREGHSRGRCNAHHCSLWMQHPPLEADKMPPAVTLQCASTQLMWGWAFENSALKTWSSKSSNSFFCWFLWSSHRLSFPFEKLILQSLVKQDISQSENQFQGNMWRDKDLRQNTKPVRSFLDIKKQKKSCSHTYNILIVFLLSCIPQEIKRIT